MSVSGMLNIPSFTPSSNIPFMISTSRRSKLLRTFLHPPYITEEGSPQRTVPKHQRLYSVQAAIDKRQQLLVRRQILTGHVHQHLMKLVQLRLHYRQIDLVLAF